MRCLFEAPLVPTWFGVWLTVAGLGFLPGCSSRSAAPLLPCPAGGIAALHLSTFPPRVTSDPGNEGECSGGLCIYRPPAQLPCSEADGCLEIASYKDYACAAPQICPDVGGPAAQLVRVSGPMPDATLHWLLTNCSTGTRPLTLHRLTILGDERCAFGTPTLDTTIVESNETAVLRVPYHPPGVGEDHATLRVDSDAENAPALHLIFCGVWAPPVREAGPLDRGQSDLSADS